MAKEPPFSFEEQVTRLQEAWRASEHDFVPLRVAAAMTFHPANGSAQAIATRQDFEAALNLAATAVARLVPVYLADRLQTALEIDLTRQFMSAGATELRSSQGPTIGDLRVKRADALHAISVIRSRGLPFGFVGKAVSPRQNCILGGLPAAEYQRIASQMELVPLELGQSLYEPGVPLRHAHFPVSGVVSRLHVTAEGESTEIAIIGNEGLVGVALLLGGRTTSDRAVVQIAGHAYRMSADALLDEFGRGGELQPRALRYVQTLMTQMAQTAVCNRHHSIEQRLCRWLLFTLDRIEGNEILMTQELISQMLGVTRPGVTEAAGKLQAAGLIETRRGAIVVHDRAKVQAHACECHSVVKRESERILGDGFAAAS